jgi:hypothetical protein
MSSNFNAEIISAELTVESDTHEKVEIAMPLTRGNMIPAIIGVEIEHPESLTSVGDVSEWALTDDQKSSMPEFDNRDVIACGKKVYPAAANLLNFDAIERINFPAPIPITMDKIYFNGLCAEAHTYKIRIYVVPRYIKGLQQKKQLQFNAQF